MPSDSSSTGGRASSPTSSAPPAPRQPSAPQDAQNPTAQELEVQEHKSKVQDPTAKVREPSLQVQEPRLQESRLQEPRLQEPRLIVALDYANLQQCEALLRSLDPAHCRLKIGKELFTACGPAAVDALHKRGFEVFLDLKFHDIPATVAKAVAAAADLGVWMVNVHAAGGPRMLEAAANSLASLGRRPLLIGVTVLTSMEQQELTAIGIEVPLEEQVKRLTGLVRQSGLDGVVCSARETGMLRREYGRGLVLVTPGIRPAGAQTDDQRRIHTPEEAVRCGSDYLVVGRPITQAADPAAACRAIAQSLADFSTRVKQTNDSK